MREWFSLDAYIYILEVICACVQLSWAFLLEVPFKWLESFWLAKFVYRIYILTNVCSNWDAVGNNEFHIEFVLYIEYTPNDYRIKFHLPAFLKCHFGMFKTWESVAS